jgi:carboxyl-terminal processing protease
LSDGAGATIGMIRFNFWMPNITAQFGEAFARFQNADAFILDLRGNLGGAGGMVMGIGGFFVNESKSLGTLKMRDAELKFTTIPQYATTTGKPIKPFNGPVAIIIDGISASTTEVFAAGMQDIGRVRVFGQTSAGAALPALMTELPNGDVLLHAFADFIPPSGTSVEGRGVIPDEVVALTRDDLAAGRDAQVDAAVAWIQSALSVRESNETGGENSKEEG